MKARLSVPRFVDHVSISRQGIKDPLREDVKLAVEQCQVAGIMVRMVTGDNIATAKVSKAGVQYVSQSGYLWVFYRLRVLARSWAISVLRSCPKRRGACALLEITVPMRRH